MRSRLAAGVLLLLAAQTARAGAEATRIEGEVVSASSRWSRDGRSIITESVVRDAGGRAWRLRQLGGSVDGLAMVTSHGPPLLLAGDRVVVRAGWRGSDRPLSLYAVDELTPAPLPEGALGFVRARTGSGAPLRFAASCVFVAFHADGTSHVPGDQELDVLDGVLSTWEDGAASCSYLSFVREGTTAREVGLDGFNVVRFREERWCRPLGDGEEECHPPQAHGVTTLTFVDEPGSPRDGEIVDADIELNAVGYSVSVDGETLGPPGRCLTDLANTATHEVGHLLGLAHTCWEGELPQPVDHRGDPVPRCSPESSLPAEVTEATMFYRQDCGETKKATLTADDVAGMCAAYPEADDPARCERSTVGGGCCSVTGSGPDPLLSLLVLVLLYRSRRSTGAAARLRG